MPLKRYWKLIQQDGRKLNDKRFYRPTFRAHLTNKEILGKLLSYSQELRGHYELYQLLLFHFQEKNSGPSLTSLKRRVPAYTLSFRQFLELFER